MLTLDTGRPAVRCHAHFVWWQAEAGNANWQCVARVVRVYFSPSITVRITPARSSRSHGTALHGAALAKVSHVELLRRHVEDLYEHATLCWKEGGEVKLEEVKQQGLRHHFEPGKP